MTFFSSVKSGQVLELACGYSYAEKSEKNIDAKIEVLSFTVFWAFAIENCDFYSQLIEEYKKKQKLKLQMLKKR